jgi:hypothetical protein
VRCTRHMSAISRNKREGNNGGAQHAADGSTDVKVGNGRVDDDGWS